VKRVKPLRARLGRVVVLLAMAASAGGCSQMTEVQGLMFTPRLRECDGFDVPLTVFIGPSHKELRARVLARNVDHDLPFVVETTADTLVLIGFTPVGTKAFTLVRTGDEVEVENLLRPAPLLVPPRNVMEDVLAMSVPSPCATAPDGVATATFDEWLVSDTCSNNRPVQRHIAKTDAKPGEEAELEIDYRDDGITVRQKRCGYSARYVLQVSAPILPADGVSDEDEE